MRKLEMRNYIRRKWDRLLWRINNATAYLRKGITCEFESFTDFYNFAMESGIRYGDHCHRKSASGPYSRDNLEFISAEDHYKISGREKRKLSDDDALTIRDMYEKKISTRKIARQFNVSQTLVWYIVSWNSYKDVGHLCPIHTIPTEGDTLNGDKS